METVELAIHGEHAEKVPSAIKGYPQNKRIDYSGDGFAVIVTEQYFFRTNSNLQTTLIFDLVDETTCKITVIAGGGGSDFLQHDWGTESGEANKLLGKIETFCREHGLEITHL